jgi:hypothetical protein
MKFQLLGKNYGMICPSDDTMNIMGEQIGELQERVVNLWEHHNQKRKSNLSLSLSLTHTHTHTHMENLLTEEKGWFFKGISLVSYV